MHFFAKVNVAFFMPFFYTGELQSAERIFRSALTFVTAQDSRFFSESWGETETLLARQIALFNMGKLHEHLKQPALAVHYYLLALSHAPVLHLGTATQTLTCLSLLLSDKPEGKKASSRPAPGPKMAEAALVERLEEIAKENNLTQKALDGSTSASNSMPKRVAFALDYSGSMSGGKIRAAIGSLNDLFVNQLASQDELMILKFSHSCTVELPLTKKQHNEERISNLIRSLHQPGGGTALYDAIKASVSALPSAGGYASGNANNDWVVVLTDGQEGASEIRKSTVENVLRSAACGFVMMGVGSDVNADELEGLVRCAKKGFYVPASGDQEGIRKAFGRVATLIQGQVIMEDL